MLLVPIPKIHSRRDRTHSWIMSRAASHGPSDLLQIPFLLVFLCSTLTFSFVPCRWEWYHQPQVGCFLLCDFASRLIPAQHSLDFLCSNPSSGVECPRIAQPQVIASPVPQDVPKKAEVGPYRQDLHLRSSSNLPARPLEAAVCLHITRRKPDSSPFTLMA